jgi:hypothetical protein
MGLVTLSRRATCTALPTWAELEASVLAESANWDGTRTGMKKPETFVLPFRTRAGYAMLLAVKNDGNVWSGLMNECGPSAKTGVPDSRVDCSAAIMAIWSRF